MGNILSTQFQVCDCNKHETEAENTVRKLDQGTMHSTTVLHVESKGLDLSTSVGPLDV